MWVCRNVFRVRLSRMILLLFQVLDMPLLDQQLMLQMQNTSFRLRKQLALLEQVILPIFGATGGQVP